MRIIYSDEAGTSSKNNWRVVVGVVVEADKQLGILEGEIKKIYDTYVPSSIRDGFVFHATEVFSGGKKVDRDQWKFSDRLDFIKAILRIPFLLDLPIGIGTCEKGVGDTNGLSPDQLLLLEHLMAFSGCVNRITHYLTVHIGNRERAILVAEDIPQVRRHLLAAFQAKLDNPPPLPGEYFHAGTSGLRPDPKASFRTPRRDDQIIGVPYFSAAADSPALCIADACAFSIRRWKEGLPHGGELMRSLVSEFYFQKMQESVGWRESKSSRELISPRFIKCWEALGSYELARLAYLTMDG